MQKYYTPNISEFYTGFECEYFNDTDWEFFECNVDNIHLVYNSYHEGDLPDKFRVKYLDISKQDIISGLIIYEKGLINYSLEYCKYFKHSVSDEVSKLVITHYFNNNTIEVIISYKNRIGNNKEIYFDLPCKNINEFRKIAQLFRLQSKSDKRNEKINNLLW